MAPLRYDSLELAELVVRFRSKRRYRYRWLAVSRLMHQVVAYVLGDRSRRSCRRLWQQIPPAYRRKLCPPTTSTSIRPCCAPGSIGPASKAAAARV